MLVDATGDRDNAVRDIGGGFYEVDTLLRWYSPSHARGQWPEIYSLIRWVQERFAGCEVFYFPDNDERPNHPVTEDDLAELWRAWAACGSQNYRGYNDTHHHCGGPMAIGWSRAGLTQLRCIRCNAEISVNNANAIVSGVVWPDNRTS